MQHNHWYVYIYSIGLLVGFCMLWPHMGHAAAWPIGAGKRQSIHTLSFYQTQHYFDDKGTEQPSKRFSKMDYTLFREYGITDKDTLGISTITALNRQWQDIYTLNLPTQTITYSSPRYIATTEVELFFRRQLGTWRDTVWAVQPLVKIPTLYTSEGDSHASVAQLAGEMRVLAGRSFGGTYTPFINGELAYRHYTNSDGPAIHLDLTAGAHLTKNIMIMPQLFMAWDERGIGFVDNKVNDHLSYDLTKAQLSLVYRVNERFSLQGGVMAPVAGQNTGAGGGMMLSVWHRF